MNSKVSCDFRYSLLGVDCIRRAPIWVGGKGQRWAKWWFKKWKRKAYGCIRPSYKPFRSQTWLKLKGIYYMRFIKHPRAVSRSQPPTGWTARKTENPWSVWVLCAHTGPIESHIAFLLISYQKHLTYCIANLTFHHWFAMLSQALFRLNGWPMTQAKEFYWFFYVISTSNLKQFDCESWFVMISRNIMCCFIINQYSRTV